MPRTVEYEALRKHTIRLYEGDFERLSILYAEAGGANVVLRRIVRAHLEAIEAKLSDTPKLDLGDTI